MNKLLSGFRRGAQAIVSRSCISGRASGTDACAYRMPTTGGCECLYSHRSWWSSIQANPRRKENILEFT